MSTPMQCIPHMDAQREAHALGEARVGSPKALRLALNHQTATIGAQDLITIDIGGTSCDIALVTAGAPLVRAEGVIDPYSVRMPMVDVIAIGTGGGSIAIVDGAAALRVGPESGGATAGRCAQ